MALVERALCGDEMGLGKTVEAICTMNTLGVDRYLIVCPASLLTNWKRELEKWSTSKYPVHIFSSKTKAPRDSIILLSYGLARPVIAERILRGYPFDGLICDECQHLKNDKSQRTKNILGYKGFFLRAEIVLALSGTPIVNRPSEIYTVVNRLNPKALGVESFHEYGLRFCDAKHDGFKWNYSGAKNLAQLGQLLRAGVMVRRLKSEVLPQLPAKIRRAIYLDKTEATDKVVARELAYHDLQLQGRLGIEGQAEVFRVRIQLGLTKVKAASAYIRTLLEGGVEKMLVFGYHREVIARMIGELSDFESVVITGATPKTSRQFRVDRFQIDPQCRIFFGAITAAGVGLNLTAASHVVVVEPSWVPGENEQCEDRCHRIGQINSVQVDYLIYEQSVDERVLQVVTRKARNIDLIMNH